MKKDKCYLTILIGKKLVIGKFFFTTIKSAPDAGLRVHEKQSYKKTVRNDRKNFPN